MFRTQDGRTAKLLGTISWDWSIGVVAALTQYAAVAVAAYVLGSIPFAYVWTRVFAHADLRHLGTGNTSIYSSFFNGGYRPAALTLASNCAIGLLTVQIADVVLPGDKAALMTAIFFATAGPSGRSLSVFAGAAGVRLPLAGRIFPGFLRRPVVSDHCWHFSSDLGNCAAGRKAHIPGHLDRLQAISACIPGG